jgi:hypothetical protein
MTKAKKPAAPLKPEQTRTRTAAPEKGRTMQFDKLGKVITWKVPDAPYEKNENLRAAFVGGFEARVQQVQSDSDEGLPVRFEKDTDSQRAFEDGYHEAANQDGEHLAPATLKGSNVAKPGKAAKKR